MAEIKILIEGYAKECPIKSLEMDKKQEINNFVELLDEFSDYILGLIDNKNKFDYDYLKEFILNYLIILMKKQLFPNSLNILF